MALRTKVKPKPVYVSFRALEDVIIDLQRHVVPKRINERILYKYSESMRRQLYSSLKFLRLVDKSGNVLPQLHRLVAAHGTAGWEKELSAIVREAYRPLMAANLRQMRRDEFKDLFQRIYPSTDGLTAKSTTFFVSACRAAGITLSEEIVEGRRNRRRPVARADGQASEADTVPDPLERITHETNQESPGNLSRRATSTNSVEFLTGLLDQTTMSPAEQEAVWTLLKYVNRRKGIQSAVA